MHNYFNKSYYEYKNEGIILSNKFPPNIYCRFPTKRRFMYNKKIYDIISYGLTFCINLKKLSKFTSGENNAKYKRKYFD